MDWIVGLSQFSISVHIEKYTYAQSKRLSELRRSPVLLYEWGECLPSGTYTAHYSDPVLLFLDSAYVTSVGLRKVAQPVYTTWRSDRHPSISSRWRLHVFHIMLVVGGHNLSRGILFILSLLVWGWCNKQQRFRASKRFDSAKWATHNTYR